MLRLEDILPADDNVTRYDKNKPPTFRQHPAIVFLHITVLMLDSFDQNEMTFTTGERRMFLLSFLVINKRKLSSKSENIKE